MINALRRIPAGLLQVLLGASASILLLRFPLQVFPAHDLSLAPLPVLTVALLGGPIVGALAGLVTAVAAVLMGSMTGLVALLLLAAPLLGYVHSRQAHPAYACLVAPVAASLVDALLIAGPGTDRVHLITVDVLQSSISLIGAYGLAMLIGVQRRSRKGGWAGRPLKHRLFVSLATVATLLTCGLGLLSATSLQERLVRTTLSNLQLLAFEIAESTQVMLHAHGRSLSAFGRTLSLSDLESESEELSARVSAYTSGQGELLTVLVARPDGEVVAAAATCPTLSVPLVLADNVADRDYFRGAIAQNGPYVTDTFRGRGFGSDIIVAVSAPIHRGRELAGVIEGSLNLALLSQLLDSASSRRGLDIVLVDRVNRIVAARGSSGFDEGDLFVKPASSYSEADLARSRVSGLPADAMLTASARLDPYGWTVNVAQPIASLLPALEVQFRTVVRDGAVALLFVFAVSILFAGILARPLGQFSVALGQDGGAGTTGLLRNVRGAPAEIRRFALALVRAQRRQRRSLFRQQQLVGEKDRLNKELRQLNVELDQIVEARTRVLAERERQLRASETRWRTMAEIAPDAVVVIDEENVIHFVNTAALAFTGYEADDLVGKRLEILIPERMRRGHWQGLQRYVRTNTPTLNWRSSEALLLARDGTERPVEIAFGEYVLDGQRYFAGYLRDIAARKRHEAEVLRARDLAEAANRSKDSFLATMSHEIRTPLHGLIGTLDLMAREDSNPRTADRLNIARNSARSLLQVANDVLDLSGIEAGRVRIERVAFDLRDLVAVVIASFEAGATEKGLRLEHEIGPDVPGWVEGDPLRLRQILANLVNNALKFTPQGRVSLAVTRGDAEGIVFDVTDTGIGVPHDKREHIFERFAQAEDERTRRFGGAGLGLAISRLLARAMGGELKLVDTGPLGSTFRLALPLPVAQGEPSADGSNASVRIPHLVIPDPGRPPRVLVVEDNPANRYVVEAYLQEIGAVTLLAESADLGLAELLRQPVDLVLMDVQMPGKDGYQATREIRARLGDGLPIVAMTANANIGERARCEAAGMNDLLVKPFDAAGLADALNRNLALAAAARGQAEVNAQQAISPASEPLIDSTSAGSIIRRFEGRPATLRKLYSALQESITLQLEAIHASRSDPSRSVAAALHGLKGAAGMYGALRLQFVAKKVEAMVLAGTQPDELAAELDQLEQIGRDTIGAVARLLESLAGNADTAGA